MPAVLFECSPPNDKHFGRQSRLSQIWSHLLLKTCGSSPAQVCVSGWWQKCRHDCEVGFQCILLHQQNQQATPRKGSQIHPLCLVSSHDSSLTRLEQPNFAADAPMASWLPTSSEHVSPLCSPPGTRPKSMLPFEQVATLAMAFSNLYLAGHLPLLHQMHLWTRLKPQHCGQKVELILLETSCLSPPIHPHQEILPNTSTVPLQPPQSAADIPSQARDTSDQTLQIQTMAATASCFANVSMLQFSVESAVTFCLPKLQDRLPNARESRSSGTHGSMMDATSVDDAK